MSHLRERLCLVPFCDLTEAPEEGHHAIGSPHFDAGGRPLFAEPVVAAVRADIVSDALPPCSALAVSCHTRPYHAYGPVMRRVFERSAPHRFPEVRRGMEGVMEIGDVREIAPGALEEQTSRLFLACVASMTAGTDRDILGDTMDGLASAFARLPAGSTLRAPLIGTGKARSEAATEADFRDVIDLMLSHLSDTLLSDDERLSPRRVLMVHPFEYESRLMANLLVERAIFLTLLDKMGLHTRDKRLVYGIAIDDDPAHRIVEAAHFEQAVEHFDRAISLLLEGERREAVQEAARGVEAEPGLAGAFAYLRDLAGRPQGLMAVISREAVHLAEEGRIFDAFCVAQTLASLGGGEKEEAFIASLRRCSLDYCIAALESRLKYEHYMLVEEALNAMLSGQSEEESSIETGTEESADGLPALLNRRIQNLHDLPRPPEGEAETLRQILDQIPTQLARNTLHIVVRKLMADHIEPLGAKQALANLYELDELGKISLATHKREVCERLSTLADEIEEERRQLPLHRLQRKTLDVLLDVLPTHITTRLEAARFCLKGYGDDDVTVTRGDIVKAWKHLDEGRKHHPDDYGLLSYIGFVILLQGQKSLRQAEEFFRLFAKRIELDRKQGKFAVRELTTPQKSKIEVPIRDAYAKLANQHFEKYEKVVLSFAELCRLIAEGEGSEGVRSLYHQNLHMLGEVGRYDLVQLHESLLGDAWISLMSRSRKEIGKVSIPFLGELSLDLIVDVVRRVRRWWKFRRLRSSTIREAIDQLLEKLGKNL